MVQTRLSVERSAKADLFAALTNPDNMKDEPPIDPADIWQEASFFVAAGADTTSSAICAFFFYLSRYPEVYAKLIQEIRSTFSSSLDMTGPKLASCRYLRACIDETLRMSPPVGGALWRQPAGDKPLVVDGYVVPAGTQVGVDIFALHHDESYFPEPFRFAPERWLASDVTEEQKKRMNTAFAPFSVGPRSCPGKAMAYLEASMVVAKTLWYFDVETAPGQLGDVGVRKMKLPKSGKEVVDFATFDIFVTNHDGPYLVFKPREEVVHELR
jgi:cytochrome P450